MGEKKMIANEVGTILAKGKRDKHLEMLEVIALFGYSFARVFGRTLYKNEQSALNQLSILVRDRLVARRSTGLAQPKTAYYLTRRGLMLCREKDFRTTAQKYRTIPINMLSHIEMEQIAYIKLRREYQVKRVTVFGSSLEYYAVPDLVIETEQGNIHVEVENTAKSKKQYLDLVARQRKDKPRAVLYICENIDKVKKVARYLPLWEKLLFIDIATLIENIDNLGKVQGMTQESVLKLS